MNHTAIEEASAGLSREITREQWREIFHRVRLREYRENWANSYQGRRWLSADSLCPFCTREISNREYWSKKGSAHFHGKCTRPTFYPTKIPRQTWKSKLKYPMPKGGWEPRIESMDELCLYWGVQNVAGTIVFPKIKKSKRKAA